MQKVSQVNRSLMIITVTANPAVDAVYGLGCGLAVGGLNRAVRSEIFAGGKGINVSRAVISAGGCDHVRTFALVGGYTGRLLTEKLGGEGIDLVGIPTSCETRMNVCAVSQNGDACEINAPGGPVTSRELAALTEAVVECAGAGDTVILAGSIPTCADGDSVGYWASLIPPLKAKGCAVILDCSGEGLKRAVMGDCPPDMIKPNLDELCELCRIDTDSLSVSDESKPEGAEKTAENVFETAETASEELAARGISVLATLGSLGAVFTSSDDPKMHIRQKSTPVPHVANVKGAGDTYLGTFTYHRFIQNEDIQTSLSKAAQSAADHVAGKR